MCYSLSSQYRDTLNYLPNSKSNPTAICLVCVDVLAFQLAELDLKTAPPQLAGYLRTGGAPLTDEKAPLANDVFDHCLVCWWSTILWMARTTRRINYHFS